MSIRSLKEMNQAAGIKLLWSLTNSSMEWSTYMRDKYKVNNILNQSSSVFDSGSWKYLIQSREAALGKMLINLNGEPSWTIADHKLFYFWSSIRTRAPTFDIYLAIWFPKHSPKMSLLRAVKGTLLTKDVMIRQTLHVDPIYVLCRLKMETRAHLFFNCSFSSYIWSVCRLTLGLPQKIHYNITEEILLLKKTFTKKLGIRMLARLAIPTVAWHLWRERNNRIFTSRAKSKAEVLKVILFATRILCTEEPKGARGRLLMNNWL